jgi:hypothetical protein
MFPGFNGSLIKGYLYDAPELLNALGSASDFGYEDWIE